MSGKPKTATKDRRSAPRAKLSQNVRVRPFDFRLSEEVCTTTNVSRTGLYIEPSVGHYYAGMNVSVARNFQRDDSVHCEETAKVIRVEKPNDGKWGLLFVFFEGRTQVRTEEGTYSRGRREE
jgi:hypothetical protein